MFGNSSVDPLSVIKTDKNGTDLNVLVIWHPFLVSVWISSFDDVERRNMVDAQLTFTRSNLTIETLEKGVK